jgi:hypothetical protein
VRRVLLITVVAVLVLVLSAGTAFASACAVAPCDAMKAIAAPMAAAGCPSSGVRAHCDMQPKQLTSDTSAPRTPPEVSSGVVADVLVPATVFGSSAVPALPAADARGAPHLTAVIRI